MSSLIPGKYGTTFWDRDLDIFDVNGAEVRGDTPRFSSAYNGEAGTKFYKQEMGDARGGSSAGNGKDAVIQDLHREMSGSRSIVVIVVAGIRSVRRQEGL